jgi:hypothetical protein
VPEWKSGNCSEGSTAYPISSLLQTFDGNFTKDPPDNFGFGFIIARIDILCFYFLNCFIS